MFKRFLSSSWRAIHEQRASRGSGVHNLSSLERTKKGGIEIIVGRNVNAAYKDIRERCRDAKLQQLEKRYFFNIKPKMKRKLLADQEKEHNKRELFDRRLRIAIDLMERYLI